MDSALESEMLAPAAPADAASYYTELAAAGGGPGLAICSAGDGKGKGLFACRCFEEGALVLNEPKLVGAQHTANKVSERGKARWCEGETGRRVERREEVE
eukprot:SM000001S04477  [mRNA]  locus=s1:423605:424153:+ [translate_table: standard]